MLEGAPLRVALGLWGCASGVRKGRLPLWGFAASALVWPLFFQKPPSGGFCFVRGDRVLYDGWMMLRLVDSITELVAADAGCVAVSGSHGGLSSARYALAARPLLSVFNDAGVGLGQAGIAGLGALQDAGLAAVAVAHTSACIGVAQSTWESGVVAHANSAALALGLRVGAPLKPQVERLVSRS
jgi:hypothetical protein